MRPLALLALAFCMAFTVGACGHGDVGNDGRLVGGSCSNDGDCFEECAKGGDFPQGTCTVPCDEDYDCPGGTACIDKMGGICLLTCGSDGDCRGGYACKGENRQGHGGKMDVCIN